MERTPRGNEILDFTPTSLPQDLLRAIGLMASASAHTESIVEMAIAGMLGVDGHMGWAVTTHMPAPLRTSVLKSTAAIRISDPDILDELDGILDEIKDLQGARNGAVHSTFAVRPSDKVILMVRAEARTHVQYELRPKAIDQIELEAVALYNVGLKLMEFMMVNNLVPDVPAKAPHAFADPKARKARRKKNGN